VVVDRHRASFGSGQQADPSLAAGSRAARKFDPPGFSRKNGLPTETCKEIYDKLNTEHSY
jgi:hypothetical protein